MCLWKIILGSHSQKKMLRVVSSGIFCCFFMSHLNTRCYIREPTLHLQRCGLGLARKLEWWLILMFRPGKMVDRDSIKLAAWEAHHLVHAFRCRSDYGKNLAKPLAVLEQLLEDMPQVCFPKLLSLCFSSFTFWCATLKGMASLFLRLYAWPVPSLSMLKKYTWPVLSLSVWEYKKLWLWLNILYLKWCSKVGCMARSHSDILPKRSRALVHSRVRIAPNLFLDISCAFLWSLLLLIIDKLLGD